MSELKAKKNPLTEPIARGGESIYASIVRNRSGIDSGCIDFGLRTFVVEKLSEGDKQDIADAAFALYESICRATSRCAERDTHRLTEDALQKRVTELEAEAELGNIPYREAVDLKKRVGELEKQLSRTSRALEWYEREVGNCNRTSSQGDISRDRLARDHGKRATKALAKEDGGE